MANLDESEQPYPIAVIIDDATYAAFAPIVDSHVLHNVKGVLFERGTVVHTGRTFDAYLFGAEQLQQLHLALSAMPRAPRVAIRIAPRASSQESSGLSHSDVTVAATPEDQRRHIGEFFERTLRHALRRRLVLPLATSLRIRTIDHVAPLAPDFVQIEWRVEVAHAETFQELARDAFEVTLEALAMQVESVPFVPPPSAPTPSFPEARGYLDRVSLSQVKCLAELDWPLGATPGVHVVLGQNASGKTGLLRAIAAALLAHEEVGALRIDGSRWRRQGQPEARCEVTFADGGVARWRVGDGALEQHGHVWRGFSAAYGPFRRFTGGDVEYVREFEARPQLLRHLSLFSERAALSDALRWLQDLEFRLSKKMPGGELREDVVRFVNETGLLPEGVALTTIDPDGVWFRDANGTELVADELSDGYRAILSLTFDLLRHLAADAGDRSIFGERDGHPVVIAEAVVLIDEPDAHLHATWQHRIGAWLKRYMPAVQFLIATHSPIVCQAADGVLLLPDPGTGATPRMLSGVELARIQYGDVLDAFDTGAFGDGVTRSEASREKLDRLAALNTAELQRALTAEERDELRTLRETLPSTAFDTAAHAR